MLYVNKIQLLRFASYMRIISEITVNKYDTYVLNIRYKYDLFEFFKKLLWGHL